MKTMQLKMVMVVLFTCGTALAHPGPRVHLFLEDDQLYTGFEVENPDASITVTPGEVRSYSRILDTHATFGSSTQFPGFASSPSGIPADPEAPLPAGIDFFFNLRDQVLFWNGSGPVSFDPTGGELFLITGNVGGPLSSGIGFVNGFKIGTTGVAGSGWHAHLRYSIDANANGSPDGLDIPAAPAPDTGVYLLQMEVYLDHDSNGLTPDLYTAPFFLIFGKSVDQATLDQAQAYVDANLIPEPGTFGTCGLLALLALQRRRRCP